MIDRIKALFRRTLVPASEPLTDALMHRLRCEEIMRQYHEVERDLIRARKHHQPSADLTKRLVELTNERLKLGI